MSSTPTPLTDWRKSAWPSCEYKHRFGYGASRAALRVKIRSLEAEARIIRHEERKYPGPSTARSSLHRHRTWDVRIEARAAQLAYAYLRGRTYKQTEPNAKKPVPQKRVWDLIKKYGQVAKIGQPESLALWLMA